MENSCIIIWSEEALSELEAILEYVNQNSGGERAIYVLKGIEKAVDQIYPFPYRFVREPLFNDNNIRYTLKWKYKIIYKIFSDHVEIAHIYHTSQDLSKLIK
jgi:plasmid stabilization system protein ParE